MIKSIRHSDIENEVYDLCKAATKSLDPKTDSLIGIVMAVYRTFNMCNIIDVLNSSSSAQDTFHQRWDTIKDVLIYSFLDKSFGSILVIKNPEVTFVYEEVKPSYYLYKVIMSDFLVQETKLTRSVDSILYEALDIAYKYLFSSN